MRAPVAFAALRHRLTHPDDSPAELARHCHLHDGSVRAALRRFERDGLWQDHEILQSMVALAERPARRRLYFQVPDPEQARAALAVPHWLSGEFAAAAEGLDLVPEKMLLYVRPSDADAAAGSFIAEFAKVAPPAKANLVLAFADPWLYLPPDSEFVERGQRLLDYAESRHLQILKGLPRA